MRRFQISSAVAPIGSMVGATTPTARLAAQPHLRKSLPRDMPRNIVVPLENANQSGGHHSVEWNGSGVASGVYICRLSTPNAVFAKKLLLLK